VSSSSSENVTVTSQSSDRQGESELAAAWANWKQIRESVIGSQIIGSQSVDSQSMDSQIADSQLSSQIADAVTESKQETADATAESENHDSHATGEEASEIANIVDSVLADLKPKLMAEIAKKMGREKKK
jgi:hypothetical protein